MVDSDEICLKLTVISSLVLIKLKVLEIQRVKTYIIKVIRALD